MDVSKLDKEVRLLYAVGNDASFTYHPWDFTLLLYAARFDWGSELYFVHIGLTTNKPDEYLKGITWPGEMLAKRTRYKVYTLVSIINWEPANNQLEGPNSARGNGDAHAISIAVELENEIAKRFETLSNIEDFSILQDIVWKDELVHIYGELNDHHAEMVFDQLMVAAHELVSTKSETEDPNEQTDPG